MCLKYIGMKYDNGAKVRVLNGNTLLLQSSDVFHKII